MFRLLPALWVLGYSTTLVAGDELSRWHIFADQRDQPQGFVTTTELQNVPPVTLPDGNRATTDFTRLVTRLPVETVKEPVVFFNRLPRAFRLWLGDRLIASEGDLSRSATGPKGRYTIMLPPDYEGRLLTLQVAVPAGRQILWGKPQFGNRSDLLIRNLSDDFGLLLVSLIKLCVVLVIGLLGWRMLGDFTVLSTATFCFAGALYGFSRTSWANLMLDAPFLWDRLTVLSAFSLPGLALTVFSCWMEGRPRRFLLWAGRFFAAWLGMVLLARLAGLSPWDFLTPFAWLLALVIPLALFCYVSEIRRGNPFCRSLIPVVIVLVTGAVHDILATLNFFESFVRLSPYTNTVVTVSLLLLVTRFRLNEAQRQTIVSETRKAADSENLTRRLEATYQMAGGIAHEFNNPLGIILGYLEILESRLGEGKHAETAVIIPRIRSAAERISQLNYQLLELNRGIAGKREPFSPVALVPLVRELLAGKEWMDWMLCDIDVPAEADDLIIHVQQQRWQRALGEILKNAFQAGAEGRENWVKIRVRHQNDEAELAISDSGPGIQDSDRSRVFHAFFSGREVGEGTGLGLAVAKETIEANGGSLSLDGTAGPTTFIIRIACHRQQAALAG